MDQKSLIPTDIVVYKDTHREEIDFKELFARLNNQVNAKTENSIILQIPHYK